MSLENDLPNVVTIEKHETLKAKVAALEAYIEVLKAHLSLSALNMLEGTLHANKDAIIPTPPDATHPVPGPVHDPADPSAAENPLTPIPVEVIAGPKTD